MFILKLFIGFVLRVIWAIVRMWFTTWYGIFLLAVAIIIYWSEKKKKRKRKKK